ncbi:MAG: methyltransferase [Halieaceae bacterium]|nr:methyltransferase [Halieaceae bacterium]
MPTASHPDIRRIKRQGAQPSLHGNKLWKSSCLLIDYLEQHPPQHHKTVIDVGCGWGISGIWCASALAADVTSVDADSGVFPFLQVVAKLNHVNTTTLRSKFEQLTTRQLAEFDMLIAADICFWDELVDPVYNLVNRAVNAGVKHIIIADPERSSFLAMAERCAKRHCADIVEWQTTDEVKARGALMVIENA